MGSTFRYVADQALFACGGDECHHCGRKDVPIYSYTGTIVDPTRAADPDLAREEPEVSELCADCILGGNVRKYDSAVREIMRTVNAFAADPRQALEEYHRTPDIPLFLQREDWPMCCGQWCEFTGVPKDYEDSRQVPARHSFWDRGPREWTYGDGLMPESLREVSLFRCLICPQLWFTWQCT